jgi:flagellar hook-associated protein 3 FlgL
MRLSTVQIFQQGVNAILDRQFELNQTQQQIASGRRVSSPADDPIAAVQILDISEDLERVDQFQRNGSLAETQLALTETTLADVGNVLQRVRELVVQANNATQDAGARRAIAVEVEQRLQELVDLANTRDANDEYIFAGFQSRSRPFEQSGGQVVYQGDEGQRFLQVGADAQVAVREPGSGIFVDVPVGNGRFAIAADPGNSGTGVAQVTAATGSYVADDYTISFSQPTPQDPVTYEVTDGSAAVVASGSYTAGEPITFNGASVTIEGAPADGDSFSIGTARRQDLFSTLSAIADALNGAEDSPAGGAAVNNALNSGLRNLDQGLEVILGKRADIGARLNRVETQRAMSEDFALQLKETLSDVQDLDYAEAISRLNLQLVALQAAQQTFVRVQGLSLFNFL